MSDIAGIGVDLCQISRMTELAQNDRFMARCFTEEERSWLRERGNAAAESLAGLWAAKEAFGKALGCGIVFPMTDLQIMHDENGAPAYLVSGKAAELLGSRRVHLSISHEADMAIAFCVCEKQDL